MLDDTAIRAGSPPTSQPRPERPARWGAAIPVTIFALLSVLIGLVIAGVFDGPGGVSNFSIAAGVLVLLFWAWQCR